MGVTETPIALPAGGFWAARTARDIHTCGGIRYAAAYPRHCEQSEAIHLAAQGKNGLLRFSRSDEGTSYPRRRVSSTPRLIGSITAASGILGHPPSRVTTTECVSAFSRRIAPELCMTCPLLRKRREQGMPGARCTRGLVCNVCIEMRTRAYRYSRGTPAFPAQWFDGLCRALPGDEF